MSETHTPNTETTGVLLYDADAAQRVPFQTQRKSKWYQVQHIFSAIKDKDIIEYERRRDMRISEADVTESNEDDARAVSGKSFEPAVNYWNTTGARAEGYAGNISDRDKAYAVSNRLFAADFITAPTATADELCPDDDEEGRTHYLRCLFDGHVVVTEHTLGDSADDVDEYLAIMNRQLLVRGTQFGETDQRIPSRAVRLGALYDKAKLSVRGYVRRVPLHHKMLVVHQHFKAQQKATAGNSQGSQPSSSQE